MAAPDIRFRAIYQELASEAIRIEGCNVLLQVSLMG